MPPPSVSPASSSDISPIFHLVNSAYAIELGDSGVAFKKVDRYEEEGCAARDVGRSEAEGDDAAFLCLRDEGVLVAAAFVERGPGPGQATVGPFAVDPERQGRGYGSTLLDACEGWARQHLTDVHEMILDVVNHRTDLPPFYRSRGYSEIGVAPTDEAHACDETRVTRPCHFILYRKSIRTPLQ